MADNLKVSDVEGRPSLIIFEALSGEIFHILPINLATLRGIQLKAAELYPYPDPKPYEVKENPETAFDPNQVIPARKNPEYLKLCLEVDNERAVWSDRAIFDYTVTMPKYPDPDDLVTAYQKQLAKLRKIAVLPDDDYEAVLFNIVLSGSQRREDGSNKWTTDYQRIVLTAIQNFTLTASEVANGIRMFRLKL